MFLPLLELFESWLRERDVYRFLMIFDQVAFRASAALVLSFFFVIFSGPRVIRSLIRLRVGDAPEFYHKELNELMVIKANTPTMGGIMISGAILVATIIFGDLTNRYVLLAMVVLLWLSILGGFDDWLKLTSARRGKGAREGLYAWEKLLFQLGLGVLIGVFVFEYGSENAAMTHSFPMLPLVRAFNPTTMEPEALWILPAWAFILIAVLVITGGSNAVNLTDGMDGLAAGITTICAFALMILCNIVGDQPNAKELLMPWVPMSDELMVIAGAMAGATLGFLWYNCAPAMVFMGDTGSLALGGLMAYIAVVTRQEFLLVIMGGVFVMETLSVIMQVGYFKMTGGRRIFRVAPIHHHFHLGGWTEQQVVIRFWLITAVLTAVALATIKLR